MQRRRLWCHSQKTPYMVMDTLACLRFVAVHPEQSFEYLSVLHFYFEFCWWHQAFIFLSVKSTSFFLEPASGQTTSRHVWSHVTQSTAVWTWSMFAFPLFYLKLTMKVKLLRANKSRSVCLWSGRVSTRSDNLFLLEGSYLLSTVSPIVTAAAEESCMDPVLGLWCCSVVTKAQ